jgi:serine/threonine protein kinase
VELKYWGNAHAVKIFLNKADGEAWRRDLNSLTILTHANIVRIFYVIYENSDDRSQLRPPIGFVMELMAQSAADPFECTLKQLLNLFEQVARALTFAHENGVIHFDVKPDNILLNGSCTVAKLCDFGLAHKLKTASDSARSSSSLHSQRRGTVFYMAPEMFLKKFEESPREQLFLCDIYSFGKTMWQLLHPDLDVMPGSTGSILEVTAEGIPPDFKQIVEQCTQMDFRLRPQKMSRVLERLQHVQKQMAAHAS